MEAGARRLACLPSPTVSLHPRPSPTLALTLAFALVRASLGIALGMDPTPATPAAPMVDLLGFGGDEPAPIVAQSPLELSPTQAITQVGFRHLVRQI